MQFIKKLVIMTGGGARGTLMLEKNSFGVWCKLSLFDLRQTDQLRLAIISGDNLYVIKVQKTDTFGFSLGEINFEEIHVALITDRVIMYGSNCAAKLTPEVVLSRVKRFEKERNSYVTYSGRDKSISDYFKAIVPPDYNDFAIAEKNFYPAYISAVTEEKKDESGFISVVETSDIGAERGTEEIVSKVVETDIKDDAYKEDKVENGKLTPHELERRYLSLIEAAASLQKTEKAVFSTANEEPSPVPSQPAMAKRECEAEKPEVIAMARRITLRDYRVENAKRGRKATFFERSSAQLSQLMANNERFPAAERLIPGSKFVKINYDKRRFYIVGVIGRDYICYGVPAPFSETPPEPLAGYASWLPFDASRPTGEGFWMMYQDGVSGETLKNQK